MSIRCPGSFCPASKQNVANNASYLVFKDSKVIIFYSNDLFQTPPEPMLQESDTRAISCAHGLARISQWTGTEVLNWTDFLFLLQLLHIINL
jgi:hypothetical protein